MSFSEDDKEALGEDLDELKSNLEEIKMSVKIINRNLGTLVTITVSLLLISLVGIVGFVVILATSSN
jgi:hypothetical protein